MFENSSGYTARVELVLESALESADQAEAAVMEAAVTLGFDEDTQYQIGMAIRESVVNAVVHGNCYNRHKKVRLAIAKQPDRLTVTVADEGKGLDVSRIPDPLAEQNLLSQSGRGIFLIRSFMDEFEIRSLKPHGTEFRLVKYVDRAKP
jgi:serine/threonine-protein kinase RsbW